jgi:hypothetical protein
MHIISSDDESVHTQPSEPDDTEPNGDLATTEPDDDIDEYEKMKAMGDADCEVRCSLRSWHTFANFFSGRAPLYQE